MKKIILPALLWAIITCCAINVTAQNKQSSNNSGLNKTANHYGISMVFLPTLKNTTVALDLCNGGYQEMISILREQLPHASPAQKAAIVKKIKAPFFLRLFLKAVNTK